MAKAPSKSTKSKSTPASKGRKRAAPAKRAEFVEIVEPGDELRDDQENETELKPEVDIEFPTGDASIDPDRDIEVEEVVPRTIAPEVVEADSKSRALTSTDPIATYLAEIRRYPLITRELEQELAIRYREHGDSKAAEMLVTSNLRFVVKIAAEYTRFGAKLIDLVQEGNVGLMHAVREFNPYKGVRLITYAVWWIRGYIQEYLMRQYSLVRIGTTQNQRKLFYRLQKERELLDAAGQEPTTALLAGRLGVTEEEVETMTKRLSGRDISLSTPIDGDKSAASLLDFESTNETPVDETIGAQEEMAVLRDNIEKIRPQLSQKEIYLLENRLLSEEPLTLQEIGDQFGVTREAVRQLEQRLIGKIRRAVTAALHEDGSDDE
ncbi:MAG: RNA polymerase factor sigma-32 [Bdellovibrionota bacterium]